ncbi:MAG: LamG-like jellyroll fold domain-containing protein [Steroidobacteraceae bacterium]
MTTIWTPSRRIWTPRSRQRGFVVLPAGLGAAGAPRNPNLDKLLALLHFNGADAATTTVDSSPIGRSVSLVNSAQLDDAQFQFGPTSLRLIQASQSACLITAAADLDVGTGDFTIRFWARKASNGAGGSYRRLFQMINGDVVTGLSLADNRPNGNLSWSISTNGSTQNIRSDFDAGAGFGLNTWTHFSIEQFSGSVMLYVAGTRVDSVSLGGVKPFYSSTPWIIGGQSAGPNRTVDGWIDEFEYYKGVALAGGAASYTVPTEPSLPQ